MQKDISPVKRVTLADIFQSYPLSNFRVRLTEDASLLWICRGITLITTAVPLLILLFLILESSALLGKMEIMGSFFTKSWNPDARVYGLIPMFIGSLWVITSAVLIATPLGITIAILCAFYAPEVVSNFLRRILSALAAIPSVVFGLWALTTIVPILYTIRPPGVSVLAGTIVLTIMIIPTTALLADAVFQSAPRAPYLGALALGLGKWAAIRAAILPTARFGLLTAILLQTGRAIGETMAVLMVMGNSIQIPGSWSEPARTLTAHIALEMGYAAEDHRRALFTTGLFLFVIITLLVLATNSLVQKGEQP